MDILMLIALAVCVIINRKTRQGITLLILVVFSLHYGISLYALSDQQLLDYMVSQYGEYPDWWYYVSAAAFDLYLFYLVLTCFNPSSLRRDIFILISGIIAVDLVGFLSYMSGYPGDFYAGAMTVLNAMMVIRLLIVTRRDKDGSSNMRFSGTVFRIRHNLNMESSKAREARR